MALIEVVLDIDETYKRVINQYFFILFSLLFMLMLEPLNKITSLSLLFYNMLGMLFYELVFKQLINFL